MSEKKDLTHPESVMGPSVIRVQLLVPFELATVPASAISTTVDRIKYDDVKKNTTVNKAKNVKRVVGLRKIVESI